MVICINSRLMFFFRHSEDEDGIHVRVKGSKEIKMASCPSHLMGGGRRDNIYIVFYCEDCDAGEPDGSITLHIQQHKGMTYFQWSK